MEIVVGSRLHFGLLHVPGRLETEGTAGAPKVRSFGGAGMMIDAPELRIEARQAESWRAEGPHGEQIIAYAESCSRAVGDAVHPLAFRCKAAPSRHAGFGSGTQLGLAVAKLVAETSGRVATPLQELARWVGRGKRSAIGAYGFAEGGFIVEAGKQNRKRIITRVSPRHPFPEEWPIVVVLSKGEGAVHGSLESQLFSGLENYATADRSTEFLCRVLLLGVIPALIERDYEAFGNSLHEFNRFAGERFAKAQGGAFASGRISEIVELLRGEGCPAVGQTSWGPAVFAICCDEQAGARMAVRARQLFYPAEVFVARAANRGAVLTE